MDVKFIDLAIDDFDPVLRYGYRVHMKDQEYITKAQQKIAWADQLCFFFPVWWGAEPSVLKGLLDRAFTPGFAYERRSRWNIKGLLNGKKASLYLTSDAPAFYHRRFGGVVSRWKHEVLGVTGIRLSKTMIMGGSHWIEDKDDRLRFMERCSEEIQAMAVRDSNYSLFHGKK